MPKANARWNLIESDDFHDDNDFFFGFDSTRKPLSSTINSPSASSLVQNTTRKPKGLVVIKRELNKSNESKYSYRLRRMLQTDLQMASDIPSTKSASSSISSARTKKTPSKTNGNAIRKTTSLHEEFSQDIENLLKSLHSTEFVGTIDPQYHSRYVSDESLMEPER